MKFNEKTFNILSLLGVVAMLVIVVVNLAIPMPFTTMDRHKQEGNLHQLSANVALYESQLKTAKADVSKFIWTKSADEIASQSLTNVTAITAKHKVQLLGFRPQKTSDDDTGFTHLPYLVLVSGTFPNVESVLRDIESPSNRLAISLVQFASSDANSDGVNATIGVVAYSLTQGASNATTTSAK